MDRGYLHLEFCSSLRKLGRHSASIAYHIFVGLLFSFEILPSKPLAAKMRVPILSNTLKWGCYTDGLNVATTQSKTQDKSSHREVLDDDLVGAGIRINDARVPQARASGITVEVEIRRLNSNLSENLN